MECVLFDIGWSLKHAVVSNRLNKHKCFIKLMHTCMLEGFRALSALSLKGLINNVCILMLAGQVACLM